MKKLLFGILTFFGIGLSFCNAQGFIDDELETVSFNNFGGTYTEIAKLSSLPVNGFNCIRITDTNCVYQGRLYLNQDGYASYRFYSMSSMSNNIICGLKSGMSISNNSSAGSCYIYLYNISFESSCPEPEPSTINVLYNNENSSTTITCNGDNVIQIDGLSTITATNKRTPYFNINYRDQDNQLLTESYSKNILYLSGGLFKKTYTGDNEWILTDTIDSSNSTFTGYVPVFDFTGDTIVDSGNVFNNFSDNALKVLLSNIPSYIQYITIFAILVFLFSFVRRFKRKR